MQMIPAAVAFAPFDQGQRSPPAASLVCLFPAGP